MSISGISQNAASASYAASRQQQPASAATVTSKLDAQNLNPAAGDRRQGSALSGAAGSGGVAGRGRIINIVV